MDFSTELTSSGAVKVRTRSGTNVSPEAAPFPEPSPGSSLHCWADVFDQGSVIAVLHDLIAGREERSSGRHACQRQEHALQGWGCHQRPTIAIPTLGQRRKGDLACFTDSIDIVAGQSSRGP